MADIFESGYSSTLERTDAYLQPSTGTYKAALSNTVEEEFAVQSFSSGSMISVLNAGKDSFVSTTTGYRMGIDLTDDKYKWIIGDSSGSIDWNVTTANTLTIQGTITGSTIVGGTFQTSTSGKRISIVNSGTGTSPAQVDNSFVLINSDGNIVCSIGSETSTILKLNVLTNTTAIEVILPNSEYWDSHTHTGPLMRLSYEETSENGDVLYINNEGQGSALRILSPSSGGNQNSSLYIYHEGTNALSHGIEMYIGETGKAQAGNGIYCDYWGSNSVFYIKSLATSGNASPTMALFNSMVIQSHWRRILSLGGCMVWKSDGTNPNGTLDADSVGDICVNADGGKSYYNTDGGSTWVAM